MTLQEMADKALADHAAGRTRMLPCDRLERIKKLQGEKSPKSSESLDCAKAFAEGTRHIWDTPEEDAAWNNF